MDSGDNKDKVLEEGARLSTEQEEIPEVSWTVAKLRSFLAKHGGLLKGKKAELVSRYVFRFVLCVFLRTCVDMTFSSSSSLQSPVLSRSS